MRTEFASHAALLDLRHVTVSYGRNQSRVLDDICLSLPPHGVLGVVGESGSGKTMLCRAVMGLLPSGFRIAEGEIRFRGSPIGGLSSGQFRLLRGSKMAMIMQNPMASFNPLRTIGAHMTETFGLHLGLGKKEAAELAAESLSRVRLPRPADLIRQYPFQLSGGMLQRVMIGMALAVNPDLIIADEPTTALDACNRKAVLRELQQAQRETGAAVLLVTHDLDVIAEMADTVAVMRSGQVVETAPCARLFDAPEHPYTRRLLNTRLSFPLNSDTLYPAGGDRAHDSVGNR
ncbi:ABC transporter ATP-binding protein [Paenibacillus oralis]|uniref:ABC transporter ATP-binding protein n=1 Tax=Paenibacillus oralis TaxID=2490856 RepID=A0A3P3UA27_9BACL|nr:ABC transporter ATP-binding protein [Paenibacillus oralis]RRJ67205.1 ABC transporter ATP-binding protein [Paenibacillus oralis]